MSQTKRTVMTTVKGKMSTVKDTVKGILGDLPWTAEVYWFLRQPGKPLTKKFSLHLLRDAIPQWREQVLTFRSRPAQETGFVNEIGKGRRILLFGMLRYWIEHVTLLGFAFAGMGYDPTIIYLPYALWQEPDSRFDLRRHNLYARNILNLASPVLKTCSLMDRVAITKTLPGGLEQAIRGLAFLDTQYSLQAEQVDIHSDIYQLRLERNMQAARLVYDWMQQERPDLVIVPNGTILEFGVVYQVARELQIPVVTYEFGEQRDRVWLEKDAEVMRQDTLNLWQARKDQPFTEEQMEQLREFYMGRQQAKVWNNLVYSLQGAESEGGESVRKTLNLDSRPVILLATNVVGDSLTLSRQVFSSSMSDWLVRTLKYFFNQTEVQLVIRVHPGEQLVKGPSVEDFIHTALEGGSLPDHIHLVPAKASVNTYDIMGIADLGLIYTTTVGLEMVMAGVPVIPAGNTHYRAKGFTLDVETWQEYFALLDQVLMDPRSYKPSRAQVDLAWNYAYRFFFEYAQPFPWHLATMWKDIHEWTLERVWSSEGQEKFGKTFRYLAGESVVW